MKNKNNSKKEKSGLEKELANDFWIQVLNCLPVSIFFVSGTGQILVVNYPLLNMLGLSREEILNEKKVIENILGEANQKTINGILNAPCYQSTCSIKPAQKDTELMVRIQSTRLKARRQTFYMVVLQDLSDKKGAIDFVFSRLREMEVGFSLSRSALNRIGEGIGNERSRLNYLLKLNASIKEELGEDEVLEAEKNEWTDSYIRNFLSRREYQILMLLKSGARLKEVARAIGLDVRTVGTYKSRALKKLDIHKKEELERLFKNIGP
ncbi:MAG: LuxR C-terminal-related transcriptional regulator [Thermodesulfobacteriota bacterium]